MIRVGTSGWQYASWRGRFYPSGLAQRAWLDFYVTRFPVVEINNSFYILPKEETFDRWRDTAPPGFRFAVKASRFITHVRRLRNCADPVALFWSRATRLGDRLGPVLFQLPPRFRADRALLADFLASLPREMQPAFEFRDDSWRTDEVFELLDRRRAAWVMADRPGWRVPTVVTGGWSYVRFHQGQEHEPGYRREKLARWADRIAGLGPIDVYVFFNNDPEAAAPRDAATLAELLRRRGCRVAEPPAPARTAGTGG